MTGGGARPTSLRGGGGPRARSALSHYVPRFGNSFDKGIVVFSIMCASTKLSRVSNSRHSASGTAVLRFVATNV